MYEEKTKNSDFGYIYDKLVVVKYLQSIDKTVIKKLSSIAAEIDFFKKPFIHLQAMYIEELENRSVQKTADNGVKIAEDELVIKKNPEVSEVKIQNVIDKNRRL